MMMRWALGMAMAAMAGCGDAVSTSGNTSVDGGTSGTGGNACNDSCAAQARANCSGFQMGTCVSSCQAQLAMFASCTPQINAALQCSAGATYTCNSSDRPTTMSCISELVTALQCASPPDAGP